MKPVPLITLLLLSLVSFLHLAHLILQVEITVAGGHTPQWPSLFGFLMPAGLAFPLHKDNQSNQGVSESSPQG